MMPCIGASSRKVMPAYCATSRARRCKNRWRRGMFQMQCVLWALHAQSSVVRDTRRSDAALTKSEIDVPKRSAGLLIYRRRGRALELLLVHPGGPFWAKKDDGAWSLPKGEYGEGEDALTVAKREFAEEVGAVPEGAFVDLGEVVQGGGKHVRAFALEGDFDVNRLRSNVFELEWPPKSGRRQTFPEVDRAEWFAPEDARRKILAGQRLLIERLLQALSS